MKESNEEKLNIQEKNITDTVICSLGDPNFLIKTKPKTKAQKNSFLL
jgi:hypothetical protein